MASMAADPAPGQQVLSIHQTDIIEYGCDLASYFAAEFRFDPVRPAIPEEQRRTIPFWGTDF